MRRLRRAQQRDAQERKIFKRQAVAAGAAAVITLGTGFALNKGIAANVLDKHQLPIKQDADTDLLADREELAIGYLAFNGDQNRNGIPDGVELAKCYAALIARLPWKEDITHGDETYKWHTPQFGLETCDICGQTVNMGPAGIVNPKLGMEVDCPLIALHYMEHGSFSYAGDVHNARVDVAALSQALQLRLACGPDEHQFCIAQDADGDSLSDREELAIGYLAFNGDQNRNGIYDGAELAKRCAALINALPEFEPWPPPPTTNEIHKIGYYMGGLETCYVCGKTVNMGFLEIVNPKVDLTVLVGFLDLHYMEQGSFGYAGSLYKGRTDVPLLMRVLGLRFPQEPDEHQLLAAGDDLDGDLLTDNEELAAGYNLYNADQDNNLVPDGIELANQCAEIIEALPVYEPNAPGVEELYKASFMQRGIELCEICGHSANMGYWQVINPKLGLSIEVPDIVCHYMRHGSFSYWGDRHGKGRIDVALLAKILEMPRRCGDLGTIFAPADLNQDCKTDLADLAKLAEKWLNSTEPNPQ